MSCSVELSMKKKFYNLRATSLFIVLKVIKPRDLARYLLKLGAVGKSAVCDCAIS